MALPQKGILPHKCAPLPQKYHLTFGRQPLDLDQPEEPLPDGRFCNEPKREPKNRNLLGFLALFSPPAWVSQLLLEFRRFLRSSGKLISLRSVALNDLGLVVGVRGDGHLCVCSRTRGRT